MCWPSGYHVADANCSDAANWAVRQIAGRSFDRRERRPIRGVLFGSRGGSDGRLTDIDAELEKLAMDARCAQTVPRNSAREKPSDEVCQF